MPVLLRKSIEVTTPRTLTTWPRRSGTVSAGVVSTLAWAIVESALGLTKSAAFALVERNCASVAVTRMLFAPGGVAGAAEDGVGVAGRRGRAGAFEAICGGAETDEVGDVRVARAGARLRGGDVGQQDFAGRGRHGDRAGGVRCRQRRRAARAGPFLD